MRKLLFNLHLYVALIVGLFILILSVTGAIVAFGPELDALFNPPSTPIVFQEDSQWLARGPEGVDERI